MARNVRLGWIEGIIQHLFPATQHDEREKLETMALATLQAAMLAVCPYCVDAKHPEISPNSTVLGGQKVSSWNPAEYFAGGYISNSGSFGSGFIHWSKWGTATNCEASGLHELGRVHRQVYALGEIGTGS